MLTISTNIQSLVAQRSLKNSSNLLNQAIERMSTGYKLNHASDNAANYSISTNLGVKISSYQIAEDNAAQALDLLTTANDSLNLISDHLVRIRALAEQAANGTYGAQSLQAINSEVNARVDEIERLYSTTEYNGINLFAKSSVSTSAVKRLASRATTLPDLPDNFPTAKAEYNGFIENPVTYTDAEVAAMTRVKDVESFDDSKTYAIYTAEELAKFRDIVNASGYGPYSTIVLGSDIDLSAYSSGEGWEPIDEFQGVFNGNGHKITNLTINSPTSYNVALISTVYSGTIKNLGLENVNVKSQSTGAAAVGTISGGEIVNCYVTGKISGENSIGGIVSTGNYSMENCYSDVSVTGKEYVGGIAGESYGVTLKNCYSLGTVTGQSSVGGISGKVYLAPSITNTYSQSKVVGSTDVGGLIGMANGCNINDSASYSVVSGNKSTGALIGHGYFEESTGEDMHINSSYALENGLPTMGEYSFFVEQYDDDGNFIGVTEEFKDPNIFEQYVTRIKMSNFTSEFVFQVGVNAEKSSQIGLSTSFDLGDISSLRNIGLDNGDYLSKVDDILSTISAKQTEYGAAQNRLESALDEVSTQYENLLSTRSTLRDADIAKVSSQYIQQQILQQASATLMSTANQTPALALQLL